MIKRKNQKYFIENSASFYVEEVGEETIEKGVSSDYDMRMRLPKMLLGRNYSSSGCVIRKATIVEETRKCKSVCFYLK